MHVVDVAVGVVVDPVAGNLGEVRPGVRRQVRVVEAHPGVHHGHDDARALGQRPRAGEVEQRVGRDRPLLALQGVGRRAGGR